MRGGLVVAPLSLRTSSCYEDVFLEASSSYSQGAISVITLCSLCTFRAGTVALFPFRGDRLPFPPAPVSMHEVLWEVFRWLDGVIPSTVSIPARDVVWLYLLSDMTDDPLRSVLHFVHV